MPEVDLLGPMTVRRNGVCLTLPGVKLRAMLAMLVLRNGQPVHRDELVVELDLDRSAKNAGNAVQANVARLRRWLEKNFQAGALLSTVEHGYAIDPADVVVDAHRFDDLAELGYSMSSDRLAAALPLLEEALGLWRGKALSDVGDGPFARTVAGTLHQKRLAVQDLLLEARLATGDDRGVILRAEEFIANDPLRERTWELLMRAQYSSGHNADAIRTFNRVRTLLVHELGIEPGPQLQAQLQVVLAEPPLRGGDQRSPPRVM